MVHAFKRSHASERDRQFIVAGEVLWERASKASWRKQEAGAWTKKSYPGGGNKGEGFCGRGTACAKTQRHENGWCAGGIAGTHGGKGRAWSRPARAGVPAPRQQVT